MNIKCENVLKCSNYNCVHNLAGYECSHVVVALDANGKCALIRPKVVDKPVVETAKATKTT